MLRAIQWAFALMLSLLTLPAFACGGGFGQEVRLNPQQTIVLTYRNGVETYLFNPHFCGKATDFGLILPVPAVLNQNPSLADSDLVPQLEVITAPTIAVVEVCESSGCAMGSGKATPAGVDQAAGSSSDGVDVVSAGQVGVFDFTILRAATAQTFTDWLDANHFPYSTGTQAIFAHYVQAGWYFVAFKVTAASNAPPAGYQLCGDFGPIQLSFNAAQAVIPARIAAAGDTYHTFFWRLLTVSSHEQTVSTDSSSAQVTQTLRYAGALSAEDLGNAPAVAKIANQGEWLTEMDLSFYASNLTQDIWLVQNPTDTTYRRTETVYKEVTCGVLGCSIYQAPRRRRVVPVGLFVIASIALIGGTRRRWRVAQKRD